MASNKHTPASVVALGGLLAAVTVVVMSLGTMIPVATYVCPMMSAIMLQLVLKICGRRIAWAWYGAVSILSLLMAPDKEAAAVFLCIGYYPILKPWMDKQRGNWLLKAIFFNSVILAMYWSLMHLFGMAGLAVEFAEMGVILVGAMLLLGNVVFFMLDHLLEMKPKRK